MNKKLIDDKFWIGVREGVIRHLESCSSEEEFLESIERMSGGQAIISRLKALNRYDEGQDNIMGSAVDGVYVFWDDIQEIIDEFEVKDDKK